MVEKGGNKRRSTGSAGRSDAAGTSQNRRQKHPAYFISELAHVVAFCDERIPFVTLAQEVHLFTFFLNIVLNFTNIYNLKNWIILFLFELNNDFFVFSQLTKREIAHQGLQVEANATALVLKIVQLPPPSSSIAKSSAWVALLKRLLSVSIRVQAKGMTKAWMAEFVFYGSPVTSTHPKEQGLKNKKKDSM